VRGRGPWLCAPDPQARAVDALAFATIGLLVLSEQFSDVPAAVVAFAAAHGIATLPGDTEESPEVRSAVRGTRRT
jgi:hypothetical protein